MKEPKTATLDERLRAAALCQQAGFTIGFHFDPIILYSEWEKEYHQVVERLRWVVVKPPEYQLDQFRRISLHASTQADHPTRFPHSRILGGEFVTCADGKMRYLKPLRVQIYTSMLAKIKRYGRHIPVYLCMDSKQVWQRVYGWTPNCDRDLTHVFDRRLTV